MKENLRKLGELAVNYTREMVKEYYLHFSGQKRDLNTKAIAKKYPELRNPDSFHLAKEALEDGGELRERYLANFLYSSVMYGELSELSDRIQTTIASLKVEFEGQEFPLRYVPVLLMQIKESERRRALSDAAIKVHAENVLKMEEELWERGFELTKELGYKSSYEAISSLTGIDYEKFYRDQVLNFLTKTRKTYLKVASEVRAAHGLADLHSCDVPYVFRVREYDHLFPKERMVESLDVLLNTLKLSRESVIMDLEDRETKSPRAMCAPVNIPSEVYLVLKPTSGYDNYDALFHEAGHAIHFTHIPPEEDEVLKYLSPYHLSEVFAFYFQYTLLKRDFVSRLIEEKYVDFFIRKALASKLFLLRRYCAKFAYELVLLKEMDLKKARKTYVSKLLEETEVQYPETHFLNDTDDNLYSAGYLASWMLESSLSRKHPHNAPETREVLLKLFVEAQRNDWEGFAASFESPLESDSLASEFTTL